jgi:glutamate-ammonia-ligase adenylyltransferase
MRKKMRNALVSKALMQFDLKHSKGGIADIEFIVQFGVLAQTANNPELTTYTDNIRLLEGLQATHFISEAQSEILKVAYCTYRDYGHKQVLQGEKAMINQDEVADLSRQVEQIWHDFMR